MFQNFNDAIAVIGIDIGKNSFRVVGLDSRGVITLRQKWSRGQVEARLANMSPCLIGMEACVGAYHLSRKLKALGHDARLMPAKYVRPYARPLSANSTKFSCNARPDHTSGSFSTEMVKAEVRTAPLWLNSDRIAAPR